VSRRRALTHVRSARRIFGGPPSLIHYRSYFSAAYDNLKQAISKALVDINMLHGASVATPLSVESGCGAKDDSFWSKFCDLPDVGLDTAAVARAWNAARTGVQELLAAKQAAPLERMDYR